MKQTRYLTTTVQPGNRLEIPIAELSVGQAVEVIVIIPEQPPSGQASDRRAFMRLPMSERRRILAAQAEALAQRARLRMARVGEF
ncbi:MAG: hypothetical protein MUF49_15495 [Oculatellaceae cyanobacterium Prado106]|jgi:glycine/D-amino acid oxidase-like deaminating enzyme|nr:hypothetical protein [Oculatellaceae cyanobacterium Prado106]